MLQYEHSGDRHRTRDDRAPHRAAPEITDEIGATAALGVGGEVHRGEESADHHGHQPTEHRRRVQPTPQHVAGLFPRRHAAGRHSADDGAEHERCEQRRRRERRTEPAAQWQRLRGLAEGERRAPEDDPDRGQCEWYVERRHDWRERRRERGPQHDQHEDQPDVVRLPHRRDRLLDQRARRPSPLVAPGDEVPEAGAEVGAREQRVQRDPHEHHRGAHVGETHEEYGSLGLRCAAPGSHPSCISSSTSSVGRGARVRRRMTITANTAMNAYTTSNR